MDYADPRLRLQIDFILEIDRLKSVLRRTQLLHEPRRENSAEHSWHIAMAAVVLAEQADEPLDVGGALRMLLIHDIVEIDAGDTYAYDERARVDQPAREAQAAARLFGLLPADQARELYDLWDEFDRRATPEARFAHAVDRILPLLHNFHTQGVAWQEHGVNADQVRARMRCIADSSAALSHLAESIIDAAVERGYLAAGPRP